MRAEEAVEIDDVVARDGDRRTRVVVRLLRVRHDHVQAIDRAALKNRDERFLSLRRRGGGHAHENVGQKSACDEREAGGFEEGSSIHGCSLAGLLGYWV